MPKVETSVEKITPRQAENYLAGMAQKDAADNRRNRHTREQRILQYAVDMESGNWVTGVPIIFNGNGKLIDGQHRLQAVVLYGKPVEFVVVRGADSKAVEVVDTGAERKTADMLFMRKEQYSKDIATVVQMLWRYDHYQTLQVKTLNREPTMTERLAYFDAHADDIRAAVQTGARMSKHVLLSRGMVGALHILFSARDETDAEAFWEALGEAGTMSDSHDPLVALKRRLLDNRTSREKMPSHVVAAITIKAWNAWREGRPVHMLTWRPGGRAPESFPKAV